MRERPGLIGAICTRATAHVLRLSVLYALAGRSTQIRLCDQQAALALWQYADASATRVFGQRIGQRLSDFLLALLRDEPAGLTRAQIYDALGRNRHRDEIDEALQLLKDYGVAHDVKSPNPAGKGRPICRWFATTVDS
jgi:hypothetical protein